jgi:hypothetical protein
MNNDEPRLTDLLADLQANGWNIERLRYSGVRESARSALIPAHRNVTGWAYRRRDLQSIAEALGLRRLPAARGNLRREDAATAA